MSNFRVKDPYQVCPSFETEHFFVRLVKIEDAEDLLECYSDPVSNRLFNSDNCMNNFNIQTLEKMKEYIGFWLYEYERKYYVRFSIVNKSTAKSIGTIEFFTRNEPEKKHGNIGILRLDLGSEFEISNVITELLQVIEDYFYDYFGANSIVTKAIPFGEQRRLSLKQLGYQIFDDPQIISYNDYFIKMMGFN